MTGIDRRTMIAGAGAGAVLLTSDAVSGAGALAAQSDNGFAVMGGGSASHGRLATEGKPAKWTIAFEPEILCAIYITREIDSITKAYELRVRHAYVPIDKNITEQDLMKKSSSLLNSIKSNQYDSSIIRVSDNFDDFSFKKMAYLVFALDIPVSDMDFCRDLENGVIQFTGLSANNIEIIGYTRRENFAFFNLTPATLSSNLENNNGYFLQYWNTTPDGRLIDATAGDTRTHYYYSMNIHLRQRVGKMRPHNIPRPSNLPPWPNANPATLPIILDPDVGNNGGEP